jgi:superfamily II DNA/RNA helicase
MTIMTTSMSPSSVSTDRPAAGRAPKRARPAGPVGFAALGVPAPLLDALAADGKSMAFPIQADTLPDTLAGRDVLGRGKTGSGKTLAFLLPMAARLGQKHSGGRALPGYPRGLILAPTRELATQIDTVLAPLAAVYGLHTVTIFGGVKQHRQVEALHRGVDVVVACPGRLEDLMKQGFASLDAIEITVLDEADHMADLGFLPIVTRILGKTPARGQRLLFSATLDHGIDRLVTRFLHDPKMHSVDEVTSPVAAMTHHVFEVADAEEKSDLVRALASGTGRRILFMRTKHQAKKLAKKLTAAGIPAVDLHGNLSQHQRDRNLAAVADGDSRVLVATDIAARGVDIDDVELVVHVDPPAEHKAYLHRSGRTARAGHAGDVVTICLTEQRKDLADLLRKAGVHARPQQVTATSEAVTALVGEVAPYVAPAPIVTAGQASSARKDGSIRKAASARRTASPRPAASSGRHGTSGSSGRRDHRAPQTTTLDGARSSRGRSSRRARG